MYPPQPMHPSQAADPQQAYAAQYQQQQYPPQPGQYPPPAAQQGYPQYQPQPGYPQPGSAAPPLPVMPTVIEPTGGGGGEISPNPRHLIGYAVMALPTSIDENAQGAQPGQIRPRVTTDFIVVGVAADGSPLPSIEYGDNQSNNMAERRPNVLRLDVFPAEFRGAWWSNQEVVKALRDVLQAGPGNVTMGRFRFGDNGNRPPMLERMADNDPGRVALMEAYQQRATNRDALRRSVGNGITEINGGPPQKAAPNQQGQPPAPGSAYGQQGYQQPPVAQYGYGGPPPPPMPQQPGQQAAQVQYGPPPAQPGQAAPAGPPPPGWTPEAWAAAPPHIRQAYGQ